MKKILLIVISIITLFIIIIGSIYMIFFKKEKVDDRVKLYNEIINSEYNHGPLTGIRYMDSSAYGGYHHEIDIELVDDKYILRTRDINYEEDRNYKVVEYSVSNEEFKEIEDIVKKYNLPRFTEFKEPEEHELDGNDVTIVLTYNSDDNYESFAIDYEKMIPSEGYKVLHSIHDKMKMLIKSVNKIKEYKENE